VARKARNPGSPAPARPGSRETKILSFPIALGLDSRLYALANELGITKAGLAARMLDQGLRRYHSDRAARSIAAEARESAGGGEGVTME
jgi:hypothetical protein